MHVINRQGESEPFDFSKTKDKILRLSQGLVINADMLAIKVITSFQDGMKTSELDAVTCSLAYDMGISNTDYQELSYRIKRDDLDKSITYKTKIHNETHGTNLSEFELYLETAGIVESKKDLLRNYVFHSFKTDYLGFTELRGKYLLKDPDFFIIEKPEYIMGRIAAEFESSQEDLDHMIDGDIIHSSPTLFNACTKKNQLGSCFLLDCKDSVKGIAKCKGDSLRIAARAGGVGMSLNRVRPAGSLISSVRGRARGIKPVLEALEKDFKMFNQGDKRPASCAIYLSMWHGDIELFLTAGNENSPVQAKGLFYGIWMDEYFMYCVQEGLDWNLIREDLSDYYGAEFIARYRAVKPENIIKTIKAVDLWKKLLDEQKAPRIPIYVCSKDRANICRQTEEIIVSSNLCTEIMEPASQEEIAVCNLVSISLPKCTKISSKRGAFGEPLLEFDYQKFRTLCRLCVTNGNKAIDASYYVVPEAKKANKRHRPLSIGLQGWHDLLIDLLIPFESQEAIALLELISEHMYYHCLEKSCELGEELGPFDSFEGSSYSKGILHFDHYASYSKKGDVNSPYHFWSGNLTLDWDSLRQRAQKGPRNTLLIGDMPTASSAPILMNSFGLEPCKSWIYQRRVSEIEYTCVNRRLEKILKSGNLWTDDLINYIKVNGCLPSAEEDHKYHIPEWIRELFKTAYQIDPLVLIAQRAVRQPFVDQSASFNWFIKGSNMSNKYLSNLYKACWGCGLKTWSYYIDRSLNKKDKSSLSQPTKTISISQSTQANKVTGTQANKGINTQANKGINTFEQREQITPMFKLRDDFCTSCN